MRRKYTLVIAEDEENILKNIAAMIERSCPEFELRGTARDGEEALYLISALKPDLLVTDIRMPKVTGLDLLRHIREQHLATETIIISSFNYFSYAQEAMHFGARDYLLKPVTQSKLGEILGEIAESFRKREEGEGEFNHLGYNSPPLGAVRVMDIL